MTDIPLPKFPSHEDCESCELHAQPNVTPGVPTIFLEGSHAPCENTPAVVFIGQNPGFHENTQRVPFIGRSGQMVRGPICEGSHLLREGSLASVYLTNAVRCHTLSNEPPKNRHYAACFHKTMDDLSAIAELSSEVVVVTLGAPAATHTYLHLLKEKKVTLQSAFSRQGTPYTSGHIFSTYHPAAVLRTRNLIHAVNDHMQIVINHLTGTTPKVSLPTIVKLRSPRV